MRDTDAQSAWSPLRMRHLHFLKAADIELALDDAHSESVRRSDRLASPGKDALASWEPVSLGELISFHRQFFIWRLLREHPQVLLKEAEWWQRVQASQNASP